MSSWWNSASANQFTRGLTSITGQLSNNLKDILTEASEETYDPNAELTRAKQQIEDLHTKNEVLTEECTSLKKQCDELVVQKQSLEIKSDMLLAESRRNLEEKTNELKRLKENTDTTSWNYSNDPNSTWTDILEDDQPEITEYLKYQRTIRELQEENTHLRDEIINLRKTIKTQQEEKKQSQQNDDIHQMYSEQFNKCRQQYEDQLNKLRSRIHELEQWNANQQEEELRKSIEVQKELDDVDKDLLSHELEQANTKLNWYNEKFEQYADLQTKFDNSVIENNQLQINIQNQLETICQLQQQQQFKQTQHDEFNRLLNEEKQRCDALANDNESMLRLLEETRTRHKDELTNKNHDIEQFTLQIQIEKQQQLDSLRQQFQIQEKQMETEQNELILQLNDLRQFKQEQLIKQTQDEQERRKQSQIKEIMEKQFIELNEQLQMLQSEKDDLNEHLQTLQSEKDDLKEQLQMLQSEKDDLNENLQTLQSEKDDFNEQIDDLQQQIQAKDRQIQSIENSGITPGSPSALSSSPNTRTRSPSPQTFEHLLQLEAQILRFEEQFNDLNSIYNRFLTLLPTDISSDDTNQQTLADKFTHLFEQWSTYVDTLSITQQESDSLRQLLIEKQDDLEKLQTDLDLTTSKLIQYQQNQSENEQNEDEIEQIFELHQFAQRTPSRQSFISSTPGEKQQLIAQNELLSSLLADKDRELISLQQAEKTREDLIKNFENLKMNLQQIESDRDIQQNELNEIRNVLDEKIRENSSLKKEKMYFIEKLAENQRDRQEQQSIIQISHKQSTQDHDKQFTSPPPSPSQKNSEEIFTKDQYEKLRAEYDQLVQFSKQQHDESISYYNEYTRILTLYNELNTKSTQLQVDYESLQSLFQQKNQAFLQCQNELNNYQNLLYHEKKKLDEFDLLKMNINEKDLKLQQFIEHETQLLVKQAELERDLQLLEQTNFELKNNEQTFIEQLQQANQQHGQQIQQDLQSNQHKILQFEEREKKWHNEIERLRKHLLTIEESYTNDLVTAEDREKTLRNQIAQLEDTNKGQFELIQQLNTAGEQSKQALATELGTLKYEYSKLENTNQQLTNQLQYQSKCSQNLQNVLEQFKREREQYVNEHLRQYQDALREQTAIVTRLTNENHQMQIRFNEDNEALAAAKRLNDQLEKKDLLINTFRNDILTKDKQIHQYEENIRDLQSTTGSRVEKQLVKNILLSYFHTPVDKRQEVVPLLGALVGFTQDEYKNAVNALSNNSNQQRAGSGWLSNWLGANQTQPNSSRARTQSETPAYDPNKSFTELLIQYVDQQSTNKTQHPTAKFNTDEYLHRYDSSITATNPIHSTRKPSLSASANPFVNTTHLSLNKQTPPLVLPSFNNQQSNVSSPPSSTNNNSQSSSTILKDLLKS